jgi:hypothetical protein
VKLKTGATPQEACAGALAKVENPSHYLSVSPDGTYLLYSRNEQAANDLVLVENFK